MRIGVIEPHLACYGGIRLMVEFANRLVARGHQVCFYLPAEQDLRCTWMRCDAEVRPLVDRVDDPLDVLIFNDEPQWHLLDHFTRARRRVFYALHAGRVYAKPGSWEAVRAPVDLQLALSNWTADEICAETGHRPTVQMIGVNREIFQPWGGVKRYPVLCTGDARRPWKGHDTVVEAARLAGVPLEGYAPKQLSQPALGREYAAARAFAVGSWYEGLGMPAMEALACGVPLVTTDNGGSREYAIDGETALVVPPRDAEAMAGAIRRLLDDAPLAAALSRAGLEMVERDFDWERHTDALVEKLDGVVAGVASPPPPRPEPPAQPEVSVVVLAWDGLHHTQRFVESVRRNTTVPYELVIVDNGSRPEAAGYARLAADRSILNAENRGFSAGMNQGLTAARGEFVAFCNNDTVLPERWAERLLESARGHGRAGVVVPALTAPRHAQNHRTEPGDLVEVLDPFSAPPPAVVYVMRADVVAGLGAWGEEYAVASGEDVDLAFKVWVNDLDFVYDQRVLVEHVGSASADRLADRDDRWERNRRQYLTKWMGDANPPHLESCDQARFDRNRATARAVAGWMERYFDARPTPSARRAGVVRRLRATRTRASAAARTPWRRLRGHVPPRVAARIARVGRRLGS